MLPWRSPGRNLVPSPPWRPSIEKKCAQSCSSVSAEPAVIDVMVYPMEDPNATEKSGRPGHRRFSTEIVSQGSIHEIMWDEKVVSGESSFIKFKHLPATNHEQQAQGVVPTQETINCRGEARNAAEKGPFRSSRCLVGEPVREVFPE